MNHSISIQKNKWWILFLTYQGRIGRMTYNIKGLLFSLIVLSAAFALDYLVLHQSFLETGAKNYFFWLFNLLLTIPVTVLTTKRLHDLNFSGWWQLPMLLSTLVNSLIYFLNLVDYSDKILPDVLALILNIIFFITGFFVCCIKGTKGPNRFGVDPIDL